MTEKIILASGSPRRREILEMMGIPFEVIVSKADESVHCAEPESLVMELSALKAAAVAVLREAEGKTVLGADTIVWIDGQVLGKPADRADAVRMIRMLQGREHSVFTGVTLLDRKTDRKKQFCRETRVFVHGMTEEEINGYVDTAEPYDKAGAYGIQGPFAAFVDKIEGDYQNVVGLPAAAVYQELKGFRLEE